MHYTHMKNGPSRDGGQLRFKIEKFKGNASSLVDRRHTTSRLKKNHSFNFATCDAQVTKNIHSKRR